MECTSDCRQSHTCIPEMGLHIHSWLVILSRWLAGLTQQAVAGYGLEKY